MSTLRHSEQFFFADNINKVDFIIAYDRSTFSTAEAKRKRKCFEYNLLNEGLILYEDNRDEKIIFIKIHATWEVLCRYCEIMKLRMPMKEIPELQQSSDIEILPSKSYFKLLIETLIYDPIRFTRPKSTFRAVFRRDKQYLFDINSEKFFTSSIRSAVVEFILDRQPFTYIRHDKSRKINESSIFDFGIKRLLQEKVYIAAYPLHDGDSLDFKSMRGHLLKEWASLQFKLYSQPLDKIQEYLGEKYGLYYAWLGFYTKMLILPSVAGILILMYGLVTLNSDTVSLEICDKNNNITICPMCDQNCDFKKLHDDCLIARVTYVFENQLTVLFSIFMSFWTALFLESWKHYSRGIIHRWGLNDLKIQVEIPRPQFLARLAKKSPNLGAFLESKIHDPRHSYEKVYVSYWEEVFPTKIFSFSVVLISISVNVGAMLGIIIYRLITITTTHFFGKYLVVLVNAIASFLNLLFILFLNSVYNKLAFWLTMKEFLRTQTEFENSLILKIYVFQFVNHYSTILYIIFLKGNFVGYPWKYNRVFNLRQEECPPEGCMFELCIEIAVTMMGKLAFNSLLDVFNLFILGWPSVKVIRENILQPRELYRHCFNKKVFTKIQWVQDYKLLELRNEYLLLEYLELILQYGFVTIFAAAFPLGPFIALLTNALNIRINAKKLLTYYRRPVATRAQDIGVWFHVLDVIGKLALITNGFIIAFRSNIIPKAVYWLVISEDRNLKGFVNHSLSYFNTSDFEDEINLPRNVSSKVEICRYQGYYQPYNVDNKYEKTEIFWQVLAARLIFLVVYQNLISLVKVAVQWLVPEMPQKFRDQIQQEAHIENEMIIQEEMSKFRRSF